MATENGSQATIDDNIKKLFDAMDIIAAQQIKNLQFDKTVKCSITDDSKSEQGEYTVTDGSSTFKAYSESTKYSNGASVYVNIPNGDYNNKKLITGRYDQDRKDYNTNDPEKSYIDITQNLISSSIGETGIIANGEKTQITIWDSGDNFNKKLEEENNNLAYFALNDELTGLKNRFAFAEDKEKFYKENKNYSKYVLVCLIDIDDFKKINDKYGHLFGDECLKEVGKLLNS